jgi:hypothetical protein
VDAQEATRRLVKEAGQLTDRANVLMREAEGAFDALRQTMRKPRSRD